MPLVQRHSVVFSQNMCYIRKEDILFYLKSSGSHMGLKNQLYTNLCNLNDMSSVLLLIYIMIDADFV